MAIAQTPYSAFPGSATRLERIAGATTDLQHIVHQGLTYYDATFWVGANAVIRKKALDQIAETSYIGDWEIKQYIKDRTVIEDTESTIDMGIHGWRLFNYPERLSYSRHPAGLRVAVHPAAPLGQRRPADPVQAAPPGPPPQGRGQPGAVQRAVPALELHGLDLVELGQPADPARLPVLGDPDQPAARPHRAALLRRHGQRHALLRLQAARRAAHLRVQPDPARRQPGRHVLLHRPGHHRVQGAVRPHAQGQGPHRRPAVPAGRPVPADRPGRLHLLPRLRPPPDRERRLRGAQRDPGLLRGQVVHRAAQLPGGPVDPRHLTAVPVVRPAPRSARGAAPPPGTGAQADRLAQRAAGRLRRASVPGGRPSPHAVPGAARPAGPGATGHPAAAAAVARPRPGRPGDHRGRRLRRLRRAQDPAAGHAHGGAPDLVRAVRGRHAHPDLPVPEPVRRPGPAERPRLRRRGGQDRLRTELGRRLLDRRGRRPARGRGQDRPATAGGAAGHRVLRRPGEHAARPGLPDHRRPHRRLQGGDQGLPPHHDRPGHRGRGTR